MNKFQEKKNSPFVSNNFVIPSSKLEKSDLGDGFQTLNRDYSGLKRLRKPFLVRNYKVRFYYDLCSIKTAPFKYEWTF